MRKRTFRPKQSLGQNFLQDENVVRKIAHNINPGPQDTMVEIGPGFGILTKHLLPKVHRLIAIEIDQHLFEKLQQRYTDANLELVHADFLKTDLSKYFFESRKIRVVGNIPYHITSPVIFKIFPVRAHVQDLILMIQREVAERIIAVPGNKSFGILSVFSQLYSKPEILFHVSRHVFSPKPDVDSSVVRWDFSKAPVLTIDNEEFLKKVVRTAFQQRRKMLRKSLQQLPGIGKKILEVDFDLQKRPEQLQVAEFVTLANLINKL